MNKKDFVKLCMNYDKEPNEELYELWKEELKDYDTYYVEIAIKNITKEDKFFPNLNRILEEIKKLQSLEIPTYEKIKRMKEKGVIPSWLEDYENEKLFI